MSQAESSFRSTGSAFVIALLTTFPGPLPSSLRADASARPGKPLCRLAQLPALRNTEARPHADWLFLLSHAAVLLLSGHDPSLSHILQTQLQTASSKLTSFSDSPRPPHTSWTQSALAQSFIHGDQLSLCCRSGSVLGISNVSECCGSYCVSPKDMW